MALAPPETFKATNRVDVSLTLLPSAKPLKDRARVHLHELITAGPYRIVRHPIYASMLCLLLGTGFLITPWPLFGVALAMFLVGTEIRVRVEDSLLASRFGETFREYQQQVSAYVPLLR